MEAAEAQSVFEVPLHAATETKQGAVVAAFEAEFLGILVEFHSFSFDLGLRPRRFRIQSTCDRERRQLIPIVQSERSS